MIFFIQESNVIRVSLDSQCNQSLKNNFLLVSGIGLFVVIISSIVVILIIGYNCSTDVEIVFYALLTGVWKEELRKKKKFYLEEHNVRLMKKE